MIDRNTNVAPLFLTYIHSGIQTHTIGTLHIYKMNIYLKYVKKHILAQFLHM